MRWRVAVLVVVLSALCTNSANSFDAVVNCKSESGQSVYSLLLDQNGLPEAIRYKYLSQDVLYSVSIASKTANFVDARAEFEFAFSGETKGHSFVFRYDWTKATLQDGALIAFCQ